MGTTGLGRMSGRSLPRLVILDLDETLWPYWGLYEMHRGPYMASGTVGSAKQMRGSGASVACYPGVPPAMEFLAKNEVQVAICSASPSPANALAALSAMSIVPPNMADRWEAGELFFCVPGDKTESLQAALRQAQVPASQALFFDDRPYNIRCAQRLGIEGTLVNPSRGFSMELLNEGLLQWRSTRRSSITKFFKPVRKRSRDEASLP